MKRRHLKQTLSWALALALLAPMLPTASFAAQAEETFNRELAKLIQEDDTGSFFGAMELTIGSNVLTVDGRTETLDAPPEITGSRTMLPIRAVAENAGAEVGYESASKTVVITSSYGDEIRCPVGEATMTVNNTTCDLDVAAYIDKDSGRTYLPVRAVAEALNLEVGWDQQSSTVTLTAPYQTSRILAWVDQLDANALGAETAIHDGTGLWVLQFSSPSEARNAAESLNGMGIPAGPDCYTALEYPADSGTDIAATQSHYSWGAVNCKFDEFVSAHSSQFKSTGVVAVVDTGVDSTHPFLKGKVLSGYDFIDGDNTPSDGHSHGTHVAGTIIDCAGSAPVKILPVRVLNSAGRGTNSTVSAGIKYAANHGADVINLSLGGGHSSVQDQAVAYAVSRGVLVAAAAGNDNENTTYHCPAHMTSSGVVVVSAGDSSRRKAGFSNYGNSVDLMAPGVSVRAAIPGGKYGYKSGTSMATPHVAAAAVLIDMATGKTLSPAGLENKVRSATTYKGVWKNQQMGCGFLDLSYADIGGGKPVSYTVTFHANDGTANISSKIVTNGSTYGSLPAPTRAGYTFDGWYTAASGGTRITSSTRVNLTGDQTLYAHWAAQSFTVTFHANGGSVNASSMKVSNGSAYGALPTPTRTGYTFDGWYTSAAGGAKVTSSTRVNLTANQTLYAHWTAAGYTVYFDANGGGVSPSSKKVTNGSTYGSLPTPVREGYTFDGWYTTYSGGTRITSSTRVNLTLNQTLYAHWTAVTKTYTVTFHANGGTVDTASKTVTNGGTYGALPTPTRTGYTFDGWYTSSSGGTRVTSSTRVSLTANQTLYAHWTQSVSGSITISKSTLTLTVGETAQLTASTTPSGQSVTWSSDNSRVAAVAGGKVTGGSEGTATVTAAMSYNGQAFTSSCTVTVKAVEKRLSYISVTAPTQAISVGDTLQVTATAVYQDGSQEDITNAAKFYPYSEGVVTCEGNTVKGVADGTVLVMAEYQNFVGYLRIYVQPMGKVVQEVSIKRGDNSAHAVTVKKGSTLTLRVTVDTSNEPVGYHTFTLWLGARDGFSWEQRAAYFVDGGGTATVDIDCYIDEDVMLAVSLFNSDNFATGASLVDCIINVHATG